jgi:hypothetical protein
MTNKLRIPVLIMLLLIEGEAISNTRKSSEPNPNSGSVCVAVVPKPTSGEISLANPTGGGRTFNYTIQIDKGPIKPVSNEKAILISELVLKRKHLIKIRRDGKLVESFSFTFEKQGSDRLCLWFKPLYETWTLWTAKESGKKCYCK